MPLVSVIMPTRGSKPRCLCRAVASVFNQTVAASSLSVEVLVALDGPTAQLLPSDDASCPSAPQPTPPLSDAEVAVLTDPRVKVLRLVPASGGRPGRVRNVALRAALARHPQQRPAREHWVAFLDDDDEWVPTKLELQFRRMALDGTRMACGGAVEVVRDGGGEGGDSSDGKDGGGAGEGEGIGRGADSGGIDSGGIDSSSSSSSEGAKGRGATGVATVPREAAAGDDAPQLVDSDTPTMPPGAASLPAVLSPSDIASVNVVVASSMLLHASIAAAAGEFNDQRYGQDYDYWKRCFRHASSASSSSPPTPPPPLTTAAAVEEEGAVVGCSFVCRALVRYGVGSLQRSSVEKEVRQSVRAIVAQKATAGSDTAEGEGRRSSGHQRTQQPGTTTPAPVDLINGFLGF